MKRNKKLIAFSQSAIIAAMYVALTYLQEILLPGTTSSAIQFRMSGALMMLCVFSPSAIYGLTLGCVISNLINVSLLPLDMILGSVATLLAALCMYKTRNITFKGVPIVSALMPAIFNGLIIGLEIEIFFIEGPFNFVSFLAEAGTVALGEFAVLYTLGLLLFAAVKKRGLHNRFFG